jgi:signal peptidase I
MKTILSRVSAIAVPILIVAWFFLLRPVGLGGPASYDIVSGASMEPRLHTGDLVIAQAQSSYAVGDVVVYRVPSDHPDAGSLIVHRIIGGDAASGFIVKGDNKNAPDTWHPKASDIVGRSWIELPGSGRLLLVVRTPIVLATILGGLAAFWIFTSGSSSTPRREGGSGPLAWRRRKASLPDEAAER